MQASKRTVILTLAVGVIMVGGVFPGIVAAQGTGPGTLIDNLSGDVVTQIVTGGSAILGLYGALQIVMLGIGSNTSERVKKFAIALGLVAFLQGYNAFDNWVTSLDPTTSTVMLPPSALDSAAAVVMSIPV